VSKIEITDEMVNAARKAGMDSNIGAHDPCYVEFDIRAALAAVAPLIAAAEREACAQVASDYDIGSSADDYEAGANSAARVIAADIRARSS